MNEHCCKDNVLGPGIPMHVRESGFPHWYAGSRKVCIWQARKWRVFSNGILRHRKQTNRQTWRNRSLCSTIEEQGFVIWFSTLILLLFQNIINNHILILIIIYAFVNYIFNWLPSEMKIIIYKKAIKFEIRQWLNFVDRIE